MISRTILVRKKTCYTKGMKSKPHLKFEIDLWEKNILACGMDEVGRGAFAGPLVVCAVVLKPDAALKDLKWLLSFGVNDSKLVNPRRRKLIKELLQEYILMSTIQYISCNIINDLGVGKANKLAFSNAAQAILEEVKERRIFFLTDAYAIPDIHADLQKNIIRGDSSVFSIAAASILAKLHRDSYMEGLGIEYPAYDFAKNKGYGTKLHRAAIKKHGSCPQHRVNFIEKWV